MTNSLDQVEDKEARYQALLDASTAGGPLGLGGEVTSVFRYKFDFPAGGDFEATVEIPPEEGTVRASSQVAVTITELSGNPPAPILGSVYMNVLNVVPQNDNSVKVRGQIQFGSQIWARLNLIIVN
jgi:hypothetical protein